MPKTTTEIFPYICHFIFAIVIATSYESASRVFIDPEKPFILDYIFFILEKPFLFDSSVFIPHAELLLVYIIIISGWVGYSRYMIKWPHTNTKAGAVRFSLDLTILFCYFGLITLTNFQGFRENFLDLIVVLFVLFSISDIARLHEHYKRSKGKTANSALARSFGKMGLTLAIIWIIAYVVQYNVLKIKSELINEDIGYLVYLILFMILMIGNCWLGWRILQPKKWKVVR